MGVHTVPEEAGAAVKVGPVDDEAGRNGGTRGNGGERDAQENARGHAGWGSAPGHDVPDGPQQSG